MTLYFFKRLPDGNWDCSTNREYVMDILGQGKITNVTATTVDGDEDAPIEELAKKVTSKYIELSDGSIVNSYDIILLNVNVDEKGEKDFKLYLLGKKMTLDITESDYKLIRHRLLFCA